MPRIKKSPAERRDLFWSIFKEILGAIALAFVIRAFLLIPIPVHGNSMSPALKQGDYLIMEKMSAIRRFDVVVFRGNDGMILVKRVVGLPGEAVAYHQDQLLVDGKQISEPFLKKKKVNGIPFTGDFDLKEIAHQAQLKNDEYFVLGDNRHLSKDSRSFGPIKAQSIIGKAHFVYFPVKNIHWIATSSINLPAKQQAIRK